MNHIQDIIWRLILGEGERRITREMHISRETVRKYHELAKEKIYLEKAVTLPSDSELMDTLVEIRLFGALFIG
jgi:DNA-directed RNA polymerase sigma subunit (sigma70/sigma32)